MKVLPAAAFTAFAALVPSVYLLGATAPVPPKAGKVEIMKASEVKPGMQAIAWTVFEGTNPEPVPIEIVGVVEEHVGPRPGRHPRQNGRQGKRSPTSPAAMSGSPVYIDGKLIGAVALRLSVFSPDAVCGITPIELMLEINESR